MTEARKWTPGPWRVSTSGLGIIGQGLHKVCSLLAKTKGTRDADAALIAAAPDLYEALKDAAEELRAVANQEFYDLYGASVSAADVLPKISAALAKARGE